VVVVVHVAMEEAAGMVGARAAGRWVGAPGDFFFLFREIVFSES
jgi:hypothetical protein